MIHTVILSADIFLQIWKCLLTVKMKFTHDGNIG